MHRYEKVGILGRGAYGTAHLVKVSASAAPGDASAVAIAGGRLPGTAAGGLRVVKEVDLDPVEEKRRAEALREAEVLKSLSHPNIVGYDDAFILDTRLMIVMEYADGGDLAGAISRCRASGKRYHEREAMAIFAQISLALEYVHGRRILHRDLKSQNIFLTSSGVAKLGDFGIARVLQCNECCCETRIGTPQNLPPELCENQPYDFKADVWGLGVLLYEMLALEAPFIATSFAALVLKICTAEPRSVSAVYSSEVRALLGRLLAKRAEDRPSSAEVAALPHVRRSIAAMARPRTPEAVSKVDSDSSSETCSSGSFAMSPFTHVPTPLSSARSFSSEPPALPTLLVGSSPKRLAVQRTVTFGHLPSCSEEDCLAEFESPKRARRSAPPAPQAPGGDGVALPSANAAGEATPLLAGARRVCNKDLVEAGLIVGCAEWDFDLDASPLKSARVRLCRDSPTPIFLAPREGGKVLDGSRSNSLNHAIEMSATCSVLLQELEKELNLV